MPCRRISLTIGAALITAACTSPPIPPKTTALGPVQHKTVVGANGGYSATIDNDGTYLVGISITDIQMGKYRSAGGADCYWARLRSLDPSDIIESGQSTSPQEVNIRASDTAFLTRDCGTWQMTSL
jgi:hypothetical protein